MKTNQGKFFCCECVCSAIAVTKPIWDDDDSIGLSMWRWGTNTYNTGWRNRWQHIKYILKHGHPWIDDIFLTPESAREMGEYLIAISEQVKGEDFV